MPYPVIPEYITVHLGAPDAPAENVTVTFPRYIKGVAASEIYPTWNESAIRANVLAQISVALKLLHCRQCCNCVSAWCSESAYPSSPL